MLLRSRIAGHSWRGRQIRPRYAVGLQHTPFSQCTIRYREETVEGAEKPSSAPEVVTEEPQKDGESPKEKRKFSLPALAVSALAFPLGWYLNDRYGNGSSSEARTSQPGEFVEYTLVGKESVSSTCAIFRMRPAATVVVDLDEPSAERAITSVEFKQPQLQIARSYTCLPQAQGQPMDEIRFLIRKEQHGEVSSFLHRLPIGSKIELRGLRAEYHIPNDVTNALLLVGGTGIAPALQAADKLAGSANVHILWASRRREDCVGGTNDNIPVKRPTSWWQGSFTTPNDAKSKVEPQSTDLPNAEKGALVTMLESLKRQTRASPEQQHRLHVDYFVDEEGSMVKPEDVKRILKSLSRANPPTEEGRSIILVSGPPGFITYWAGSKQWAGGREVPGPLRGVLSTMDLSGWEVVKL